MSRYSLSLALLAIVLIAAPAHAGTSSAPDSGAVLVYGKDHAFFVDLPVGWRQDCETLKDHGICALFYRTGYTFENAPVVMYVKTAHPNSAGISSFIADDIKDFRQKAPQLVVKPQPTLKTSEGSSVRVFRLEHAVGATTSELVGYLAAPSVTVVFVASGETPADLDREVSAFATLVHSYGWFTDKVTIAQ